MLVSIENALMKIDDIPFECFAAGRLIQAGELHVFAVNDLNLFYDKLAPGLAVKFNSDRTTAVRILRNLMVPPNGTILIKLETLRTEFNNAMAQNQERAQTTPREDCEPEPTDHEEDIVEECPETYCETEHDAEQQHPNEEFVPHMVGPYMPPSEQVVNEIGTEQAIIAVSKHFVNSTSAAKSLADLRAQYNKIFSDLCNIERRIAEKLEMLCGESAVKKLLGHVEELSKSEAVEKVYFTDERLVIITKPLTTKDKIKNVGQKEGEGYRRLIGRMSIEISLATLASAQYVSESNVIIHNLDRGLVRSVNNNPSSIMECGHVIRNEQSCFGSLNRELVKAFSMFDVKLIFDLVVRFIKEPNMNDCLGRPMQYWQPYAEDSVVTAKPAEPQNTDTFRAPVNDMVAQSGAVETHE